MTKAAPGGATGVRPKLIYLVTEDWYFWSHRLPMARAAREAGFDIAVATRVSEHRAAIEAEGFRVHPLSWRRRDRGPLAVIAAVAEIVRLYRREQPNLVHHVALKPVVLGSLAASLTGILAQVNALTGLGHAFVSRTAKARLIRLCVTRLLRVLTDRPRSCVLLQNGDDRQLLVSLGAVSDNRCRLIPGSGIDTNHFRVLPEPPGEGRIVAAVVARMLTSKGIGTAVAAVRLARSRGVDLRLHLAGAPDPESPDSLPCGVLEAWAAEPGICWLGHVHDVRTVWRGAHIAVLPSLREGLPKCLLEAAACGRPIVASDVPGCREVVRPGINGLLVPAGDADALADALIALANDPERRRRYGEESRRLVESDLSDAAIGRQVVGLYRHLLADSAGAVQGLLGATCPQVVQENQSPQTGASTALPDHPYRFDVLSNPRRRRWPSDDALS